MLTENGRKVGEVGMISKIRPVAIVEYSYGNDGRDAHHYIAYYCPTCGRTIPWYEYATACDQCGTFYDWGEKEPRIEITRSVKWE